MKKTAIIIRNFIYRLLGFLDPKRPFFIILSYHSIDDPSWKYSVSECAFKEQIEHLLLNYFPGTLDDVGKLQRPTFVITFDDGYKDIMRVGDFLREKGIKPVLFLLSNLQQVDREELGNRKEFLSDSDIRLLIEDGWEIGSHGATHQTFWNLTRDDIKKELVDSKADLEKRYGVNIRAFSYPRGRYSPEIIESVEEAGYSFAVSMDDGLYSENIERFNLPRIGVDSTHSLEYFKLTILVPNILFRRFVKNFAGGFCRRFI